ncbi:hypothetical protein SOVF_064600 [Spinacia oleracea]|nr:hypothetical protein SOVF_064600 [Spinacia oleracea]
MLIERRIQHPEEVEPSQGETSFNSDTQLCYIEEDENLERDPMSINDQQSSDGNDNGETSFSYDDTHLCLTGEDERDSTTTNIQHSPDGNDNDDDASTLEGEKELQTPWSHSMARSFYNLLTTCQFDEHARKVCENGLNDMHNALKQNL